MMILVDKNVIKEKADAQRESSQRLMILADKNIIEEKVNILKKNKRSIIIADKSTIEKRSAFKNKVVKDQ